MRSWNMRAAGVTPSHAIGKAVQDRVAAGTQGKEVFGLFLSGAPWRFLPDRV
jgi:hypothetical protein